MILKLLGCLIGFYSLVSQAQPVIDRDVLSAIQAGSLIRSNSYQSLIVLFQSDTKRDAFVNALQNDKKLTLNRLNFMPAAIVTFKPNAQIYKQVTSFDGISYIGLNVPASEKNEKLSQATRPKVVFRYPGINLWWQQGFNGHGGVLGLIDSGVAADHPGLSGKKIIINQSDSSHYSKHPFGVRTAHGTGVACIYAGFPQHEAPQVRGVAYKTPTIMSTLAGEGKEHKSNFWLTYASLNWLLSQPDYRPSVINYSFGNGNVSCSWCSDWSAMGKIVDYIINNNKILWVISAGNNGYLNQKKQAPFTSTMTVPAESYNALTVANMNYDTSADSPDQKGNKPNHAIFYTSSRGPTLIGRKKPDLAASGNATLTCAPPPEKYQIKYSKSMDYKNGYRLMGGTSSAAPHVGGAVLLLRDAGITNPIAIKALLINSADSWTDSNSPGPEDPNFSYHGGHYQVNGSEWNPTYGWGHMNLKTAFEQRKFIAQDKLSLKSPAKFYRLELSPFDKVTLVHERRIGFNADGSFWQLSPLKLEILDSNQTRPLMLDESTIDTVHQVSLCKTTQTEPCAYTKPKEVVIKVSLNDARLDGSEYEEFALALPSPQKHL
ncbi:MAG: S8 family peptidase [Tatlockia sp.]|nr:S8 family peptidase [Tatlockia sp.]